MHLLNTPNLTLIHLEQKYVPNTSANKNIKALDNFAKITSLPGNILTIHKNSKVMQIKLTLTYSIHDRCVLCIVNLIIINF